MRRAHGPAALSLRYCDGKSEQIIGRYMKEKKPSKVRQDPGAAASGLHTHTHTVLLFVCLVSIPSPVFRLLWLLRLIRLMGSRYLMQVLRSRPASPSPTSSPPVWTFSISMPLTTTLPSRRPCEPATSCTKVGLSHYIITCLEFVLQALLMMSFLQRASSRSWRSPTMQPGRW